MVDESKKDYLANLYNQEEIIEILRNEILTAIESKSSDDISSLKEQITSIKNQVDAIKNQVDTIKGQNDSIKSAVETTNRTIESYSIELEEIV